MSLKFQTRHPVGANLTSIEYNWNNRINVGKSYADQENPPILENDLTLIIGLGLVPNPTITYNSLLLIVNVLKAI